MSDNISRLRKMRLAVGLSVRQLARQIGQQPTNVSYWERTGKIPRSDVLMPIAQALGVSVEELLGKSSLRKTGLPGGRLGHVVEKVSQMPRRQQEKTVEIFETVLAGQQSRTNGNGHKKAA